MCRLSVSAQQSTAYADRGHIVLVKNDYNKKVKEIHIGDKVRLKLTNNSKVKGYVISIDSASFLVSNRLVTYDEIRKISTRKGGVKGLGWTLISVGYVMSFFAVAVDMFEVPSEEFTCDLLLPGIVSITAGVVMVLPNYRDLGKDSLYYVSQ